MPFHNKNDGAAPLKVMLVELDQRGTLQALKDKAPPASSEEKVPKGGYLIHVVHKLQKVPATAYGNYKYGAGNYKINVSQNPIRDQERRGGIVYHFN